MSAQLKRSIDDPAYLFRQLTACIGKNVTLAQRVNAHVRERTGGKHGELGAFHNNGATDEEKAALYQEILRAVLPNPPKLELLAGTVAKGQAGTVSKEAPVESFKLPSGKLDVPTPPPVVEALPEPTPEAKPLPLVVEFKQSEHSSGLAEAIALALKPFLKTAHSISGEDMLLIGQVIEARELRLREDFTTRFVQMEDRLRREMLITNSQMQANVDRRLESFCQSVRITSDCEEL